jgi:hypothetical protein
MNEENKKTYKINGKFVERETYFSCNKYGCYENFIADKFYEETF